MFRFKFFGKKEKLNDFHVPKQHTEDNVVKQNNIVNQPPLSTYYAMTGMTYNTGVSGNANNNIITGSVPTGVIDKLKNLLGEESLSGSKNDSYVTINDSTPNSTELLMLQLKYYLDTSSFFFPSDVRDKIYRSVESKRGQIIHLNSKNIKISVFISPNYMVDVKIKKESDGNFSFDFKEIKNQ
jgi:hypothetical protein